MKNYINLTRFESRLQSRLICGAVLLLLAGPSICIGAVYRCDAKDGSKTYSDQPCAADAQVIPVQPTAPVQATTSVNPPSLAPGQAHVNETLEKIAAQCETSDYNSWYRAQNPKPSPEDRITKLKEIVQKCRAVLPFQNFAPSASANQTTPNIHPAIVSQTALANPAVQPSAIRVSQTTGNVVSVGNTIPSSPGTDAKERRASEVLTTLNKAAIQSSTNGDSKQRAHLLAPYFLKKLDPDNSDWNNANPKWPTMQMIVEKSLLDEISDQPTAAGRNIETVFVRAYAAKMSASDLQQLSTYLVDCNN